MSSTDLAELENRIAERIDMGAAQGLPISVKAGGMSFSNMSQVFEFAKMMAIGGIAVRKHLRGNPGACLAVTIQAIEWQMSPFAVANKSYSVNDQLAYEAQLIHAVILMRAPIIGRPQVRYDGEGGARKCTIWATLDDGTGEVVDYTSPAFDKITPKNSPLWKSDPDLQHFYYSVRAFARMRFPDIILGVYANDEIATEAPRDITPSRPTMEQALDRLAGPASVEEGSVVEAKSTDAEKPKRERRKREAAEVVTSMPTTGASSVAASEEVERSAATLISDETDDVGEAAPIGDVAADDGYGDDPFAEDETSGDEGEDEAEAIFVRMEGLDVPVREIDQKDPEQCRYFLMGHDAARAGEPRASMPTDLRKRWAEHKDEQARLMGVCWMRGHDAVTGYVVQKKQ